MIIKFSLTNTFIRKVYFEKKSSLFQFTTMIPFLRFVRGESLQTVTIAWPVILEIWELAWRVSGRPQQHLHHPPCHFLKPQNWPSQASRLRRRGRSPEQVTVGRRWRLRSTRSINIIAISTRVTRGTRAAISRRRPSTRSGAPWGRRRSSPECSLRTRTRRETVPRATWRTTGTLAVMTRWGF